MSSTVDPIAYVNRPALPPEPVKRFTVAEYQELIRLGFLTEDDPYELIEGWLVPKMTKNPPHEFAVEILDRFFQASLPKHWRCRCQQCITLDNSQPEPDIAIVRGEPSRQRHPIASEVRLVVEVADTTLPRDRTLKLQTYARGAIPEYWIVNLQTSEVEVHTSPTPDGSYLQRLIVGVGKEIVLALEGERLLTLPVARLFSE